MNSFRATQYVAIHYFSFSKLVIISSLVVFVRNSISVVMWKSLNQYVHFFSDDLPTLDASIAKILKHALNIQSSGHVECSFDNIRFFFKKLKKNQILVIKFNSEYAFVKFLLFGIDLFRHCGSTRTKITKKTSQMFSLEHLVFWSLPAIKSNKFWFCGMLKVAFLQNYMFQFPLQGLNEQPLTWKGPFKRKIFNFFFFASKSWQSESAKNANKKYGSWSSSP